MLFSGIKAQWNQIGQDIFGETKGNQFGNSISLNYEGNIIAIGSSRHQENKGQVKIYEKINDTWVQIGHDIYGDRIADELGKSISLNAEGNIIAIGSPAAATFGSGNGKVKIFKNTNGEWMQIGDDIRGISKDQFGSSVSLSADGKTVAIGSVYNNSTTFRSAGDVKVYEYLDQNWVQIGEDIDTDYGNLDSQLPTQGPSVSLSANGKILAIGASSAVISGIFKNGKVKIYENINNSWTQIGEDLIGEGQNGFGASVDLNDDGSILAIGEPYHSTDDYLSAGQIKIFKNTNNTWNQIGDDIQGKSYKNSIGMTVSLNSNGNIIAVGTRKGDRDFAGQVRVYRYENDQWNQTGEDFNGENLRDLLGSSISLNGTGNILAIGIPKWVVSGEFSSIKIFQHNDITLDVSEFLIEKSVISPNPTTGILNISLENLDLINIDLYSLDGKLLAKYIPNTSNNKVDISDISEGIYLLKLNTNKGSFFKRILKN